MSTNSWLVQLDLDNGSPPITIGPFRDASAAKSAMMRAGAMAVGTRQHVITDIVQGTNPMFATVSEAIDHVKNHFKR
jgi:hypothetical protein